ncbi:NAD(P)-dependent oxidoreductase [Allorhizobium sp. BGMRC 0089]|uniref:NAD-dependent epimerase/dehydratase family protein n=1 Tax=Allorhizobium sonneratiae TaxID=2934936 RepID=UPI0020342E20|nr:NAD(P)-dependent oxidoreductase [Allorhizobium sonneratiae]MCM2291448.1 NAD(P)-dependent oxidoreductase [Allorhizobium sonneratiae]
MAKTVLLTGATGFVGRQILKRLLANGYDVLVTVRPGSEDKLGEEGKSCRILSLDDVFALVKADWIGHLQGVDAVIHAAWYVETGHYLDSPKNFDCVKGTMALAQGAAEAGVKHLIGLGTCVEYRLPSDHLTVASPLEAKTLYAAAKLASFQMLERFFAIRNTDFTWARVFYLYGENEHPARLVPYLRDRLSRGEVAKLSKGTQLRDFLDVAVAGQMIADLVETGQTGPVNICSGQPITIRALAEAIADEYGRRDLLEFGTAEIHPSDPLAVVGVCNVVGR